MADMGDEAARGQRALRLQISQTMGLGDVSAKNYPKMTLIAPPQHGGALTTRSFTDPDGYELAVWSASPQMRAVGFQASADHTASS